MIHWVTTPLRNTAKILLANESSGQVAAGITLGVVIGLLPTGNLLSCVLLFLLAALRVNRMAGLCSMGIIASLTPWIDPFLHTLGAKVLTISSLQPTYSWLYDAPFGAWIGFHNTVTMGALLVGVYVSYPIFLASDSLVKRLRPSLVRMILKYRITRWLLGADITSRLGLTG